MTNMQYTNRITESQLILPSLFLMSQKKDGYITTSNLIRQLTNLLHPVGLDAQILSGRNDTYFSQKVRNLKSHSTFSRYGYAIEVGNGFKITAKGKKYVADNLLSLKYLFSDIFSYEDIKDTCDIILENSSRKIISLTEHVSEGAKHIQTQRIVYERSKMLRDAAIEHFSHNNSIMCDCCGFEFSSFYPSPYNDSCIEIHHMKPLFQYEDEDIVKTIEDALHNLIPVCPNCHRVIHHNHIGINNIQQFKQQLQLHRM